VSAADGYRLPSEIFRTQEELQVLILIFCVVKIYKIICDWICSQGHRDKVQTNLFFCETRVGLKL